MYFYKDKNKHLNIMYRNDLFDYRLNLWIFELSKTFYLDYKKFNYKAKVIYIFLYY